MIGEIINHPSGLRVGNGWLAGGDLDEILQLVPELEEYAKYSYCHRVMVSGRRGWLKVLDGYREHGVKLSKDL